MRHPSVPSSCACCTMSRRCFLAASSAALAAPLFSSYADSAAGGAGFDEYIDLAALRPRPAVRISGAFIRLSTPYWLGWPGTAYDIEGRKSDYAQCFAASARTLGVQLDLQSEPIETAESIEKFAECVRAEQPDAVLLCLQHFGVWHWADLVAKAGVPTFIFAPVGMAFTGHVHEISRRPGVHVISSLETSAVEQALRMVRARRQFEESRVLVVAGDQRNETVLERLGTKVRCVPRSTLNEMFDRIPVTDEVRDTAQRTRRHAKKVVEPTREDLLNAARSFVAAKRLMKDEQSNAITTDCLGMVSARVVPTPPCMAAALFQDAGVTYGCEADLFGAISLMFTSYLFDKPGFMNDPVPETVKNVLIAAHCVCGTRLNGFDQPPEPYILRSHSESNLGVSLQVLWREGQPVTLVRFQNPNELIVDTGTVVGNVATPPAGGCRTSVEIAMDDVEDVRDVLGFHQVVFYGNHRRDIEAFCQMYGIKAIHSPERSPERSAV